MEDEDEKNAQIEDYLSKNQGADDDSKDIGDNETASPEIATAVPQIAAAAPVAPTAAALPPTTDDASKIAALKAYLTPMYSPTKDDAAIAAARDQSNNQNFIANIGQALGNIATANSRAHGGQGVDPGVFQSIRQQGQQGLASAISAKQNNVADFLRNHELERQMVQDKIAQGTAAQKQQALKLQAESKDPESDASLRAVDAAQALYKDQPDKAEIFDGLSADQIPQAMKALELKDKTDTNATLRQSSLAQSAGARQAVNDQKVNKAYSDAHAKASLQRAPAYIAQAAEGVQNADKAMDLINQYPDANTMPPQQVAQLDAELSKIAAGGVASEHGVKSIESKSFESDWNNFMQKVNNAPTGAQLGAFIGAKKDYLLNMKDTLQGNINDYQKQVYNGLLPTIKDHPDLQDSFKTDFAKAFQEKQTASAPKAGVSSQAMVTMQAPSGKQFHIPADQVDSLKAKKWTEVTQTAGVQ